MAPSAVLIHVPDVQTGLAWYQKAFAQAMPVFLDEFDFTVLDLQGFSIEIVQADEKVAAGKSGSVLYWWASDFEETLTHFLSLGAKVYRGPLNIENGMVMCQVEDPFGNLIGLRGMS
ncbi:glyoxalase/bleomycin resistance/dioxygenase family protein [Vibrio fluvialis]|nr:glyoxalase/bleomycin resistance/dioxygenase family protein [Vibrio fluvialis]